MAKVSIYLHFNGNCEEAFSCYKNIFGAEITAVLRYGDVPRLGNIPQLTENDLNKIENICLQLNEDTLIMGSDSLETFGQKTVVGNNFSIYITPESKDKADKFFSGLSEGGKVTMPMTTAHWGDYFGMCIDKFGISWLVNFTSK